MIKANITYDELTEVESPEEASEFHLLIQHRKFIRGIQQIINNAGYKTGEVRIATNRTQLDMIVAIHVGKHEMEDHGRLKLWFAAMNCNSRKRASHIYGGVTLRNLHSEGETACVLSHNGYMSKHTKYDWKEEISKYFDQFIDESEIYPNKVEVLKNHMYRSHTEAYGLLIRAVNCGYIPVTFVEEGINHINENHKRMTRSAWSMMGVFTPIIHRCEAVYDRYPRRDQLGQLWNVRQLITQDLP